MLKLIYRLYIVNDFPKYVSLTSWGIYIHRYNPWIPQEAQHGMFVVHITCPVVIWGMRQFKKIP
jgi:hypothetical protein